MQHLRFTTGLIANQNMKQILLSVVIVFSSMVTYGQNPLFISTKDAISDIEFMISTIEDVHYNPYFRITKEQLYQNKANYFDSFDGDSILMKKFMAVGMTLAAQMSGGHTALNWQNEAIYPELRAYQYIPFTGMLNESMSEFVVTRSTSSTVIKGTVISSINGVSMVELFQEAMNFIGGIEAFRNSSCEKILPLYLFFTDRIKAPYLIEVKEGPNEVESQGLGVYEMLDFLNEKKQKENYTFQLVNGDVGLISYNRCENLKGFEKFLKGTFKTIRKENVNKLIIDIRENGGGDSGLNDLLLSYITTTPYQQASGRIWKVSEQAKNAFKANPVYEKMMGKTFFNEYQSAENQTNIEDLEGELLTPVQPTNFYTGTSCFLIGPNTFSSANFLADAVKTYKLSTLIGAATGENTNDFGEMISFNLPFTNNVIFVSSTYDIGANANPDVFEPVYPDIKVTDDVLIYAIKWMDKD